MAVASPWRDVAGRAVRVASSASSIDGRSSRMRLAVWTISTAQAAGSTDARVAAQHVRHQQGQDRPQALGGREEAVAGRPRPPSGASLREPPGGAGPPRPGVASPRASPPGPRTSVAGFQQRAHRRRLPVRRLGLNVEDGDGNAAPRGDRIRRAHGGLPRRGRRHRRGRRRQGPHQGPGEGDLQRRGADGDRLLRRDVPARPVALPGARAGRLHRRCRHQDPGRHR